MGCNPTTDDVGALPTETGSRRLSANRCMANGFLLAGPDRRLDRHELADDHCDLPGNRRFSRRASRASRSKSASVTDGSSCFR